MFLWELLEELEDQGDVIVSPSFILRLPLGSFLSFLNNDLLLYLYLRLFTFLGLEGSELLLSLDLFIIDDSQKVEPDLSGRVLFDSLLDLLFCFGQPGLLGHLAEPIHAWRPLENDNPLHRYQHANPQWHFYGKADIPSYERIIAARDARIAKHPEMTFVAFHLGSMSHDVGMVDSRLAIYPNMYAGVAGRVRFLTRQSSEKVRDFFIKYQDRLMYGTDLTIESWGLRSTPQTPEESQRFKERLKKRYRSDWDYFTSMGRVDYDGHETQGLGLPKEVLEKFYYKNAQSIIPGL